MEESRVQRQTRKVVSIARSFGMNDTKIVAMLMRKHLMPPHDYLDEDLDIVPIPFGEMRGTIEEDR